MFFFCFLGIRLRGLALSLGVGGEGKFVWDVIFVAGLGGNAVGMRLGVPEERVAGIVVFARVQIVVP